MWVTRTGVRGTFITPGRPALKPSVKGDLYLWIIKRTTSHKITLSLTPAIQPIMCCSEMSKKFLLIQFIFIIFSSESFKSLWPFPSFYNVTVIKHIKQFIKQQSHWPQGVLQLTFIRQLATLFKQYRALKTKTKSFVFQFKSTAHPRLYCMWLSKTIKPQTLLAQTMPFYKNQPLKEAKLEQRQKLS